MKFAAVAALILAFLVPYAATGEEAASGATATVTEIVDGDTVVLDRTISGARQVRLVGLQAPKLPLGRAGFEAWPLADEAKTALSRLVLGKQVTLDFTGEPLDRHGRLLAHVKTENGTWIQGTLLAAGMARVYSFADNRARVDEMLTEERAARGANRGIWGHPFYAVRTPNEAWNHLSTFQFVEGRIVDAARVKGTIYLNFGEDWRTDFTIRIRPQARRVFDRAGIDPTAWKGRWVRVRGWLRKYNGPMIDASHPEQIEVLTERDS